MSPQFYRSLEIAAKGAFDGLKQAILAFVLGAAVLAVLYGAVQFSARATLTYFDYSVPDYGEGGYEEDQDYGSVDSYPIAREITRWDGTIENVPLSTVTFTLGAIVLAGFKLVRRRERHRLGRAAFELENIRALAYAAAAAFAAFSAAIVRVLASALSLLQAFRAITDVVAPDQIPRQRRQRIVISRVGTATAA